MFVCQWRRPAHSGALQQACSRRLDFTDTRASNKDLNPVLRRVRSRLVIRIRDAANRPRHLLRMLMTWHAMMATRGRRASRSRAMAIKACGRATCGSGRGGHRSVAASRLTAHHLSYYKSDREWISVSGLATISSESAEDSELYAPAEMWFPDEGDPTRHTVTTRLCSRGRLLAVFPGNSTSRSRWSCMNMTGWLNGTEPDSGDAHLALIQWTADG